MDLFKHLTTDTILLTPNSRLAAVFTKKHHAIQIAQGKSSWISLDILSLKNWLQRTWAEYVAQQIKSLPMLLTANQEQVIWEEILRQAPESDYLLQLSRTAELAQSAWNTLQQWRVNLNNPDLSSTEDSVIFQQWAHRFMHICQQRNWLDYSSISNQLIDKIMTGELLLPAHILLAGFTGITPQQQALFNACEQAGSRITRYQSPPRYNNAQRVSVTDLDTEITTMARWTKFIYEHDSNATICCVVPSLENLRERILSIFCAVFSPPYTIVHDHITLPFNISVGKSLTNYPLLHTALKLLSLDTDSIPIETINYLLRSPFIAGAESEMFSRARLVNALRENNIKKITLEALCKTAAAQQCPLLVQALKNYLKAITSQPSSASISKWITLFMANLTILGWPGERSLDSAEYQTGGAWLKTLSEYTTYDSVLGTVKYSQALHYLTDLTRKKIFQPESPEARIQILGALEAAEIPFDYLWVMGLDDTAWPQIPKPNPFIPQRLQNTLQMPHATAERELIFTRDLTEQLQRSASMVIFSYAQQSEDTELRPSPLITNIVEIKISELKLADFVAPAKQIFNVRETEQLHDEQATPITDMETIYGGTNIFKNQAACPFKAFAEIRLQANKPEPLTLGLRATERGSIIHKILELIWKVLKDQQTLLTLEDEQLKLLIAESVAISLDKVANNSNRRYLQLENQRLQKLTYDWLQQEKLRPPFKVKSLEQKYKTHFGKIPLQARVDRVDELESGNHIIIDYKSGKNNSEQDWLGERPDEPQLPLYYLLNSDNTDGILYAQINREAMQWKGLSAVDLKIRGVKTSSDWSQQVTEWHIALEKLAENFYNGHAAVNPKKPSVNCKYCHLPALCRINET